MSGIDLKEQEKPQILIGTSGFSYQDWKGHFYPETISDSAMLRHYAKIFNAVEINSSYYAIPQPKNMEAMVKKTEGNLEFVVKAHQDITHNREKAEEALPAFKEGIKPFQNHNVLGRVIMPSKKAGRASSR